MKWINKPRSGPAVKNPMNAVSAKAFAAGLTAKFKAFDAAGGKRPATKAAAAPKPDGDPRPQPPPLEDIPF